MFVSKNFLCLQISYIGVNIIPCVPYLKEEYLLANNLSLEKFDHELSFYGLVLDIKNCIRTNFYRQIDSCWKAVGRSR